MKPIHLLLAAAMFLPAAALAEPAPAPVAATPAPDFTASMMGVSLNIADLDKSLKFYRDGIGMTVLGGYDLPNGHETFLTFGRAPGPMLVLVSGLAGMTAASTHPVDFGRIVVQASDVAVLQSRLKTAGYTVSDIHAVAGRQILLVTDPDGYRLEFVTSLGA